MPIWYWTSRDLNKWADQNDIETITKKINGGKNGLADRLDYYGRLALVVCGYGVSEAEVRRFQAEHGLDVDGDVGPKTRSALHKRLVELGGTASESVRSSPVVEETVVEREVPVPVDRPVVTEKVEKEVRQKTNWLSSAFATVFGTGGLLSYLAGMDPDALILVAGIGVVVIAAVLFGGEWIVRRVKSIRKELEA
ncbi:hypothetical protein ABID21_003497 [Pseudorhizobium tarimense]|uniref:Peptidoglycan binding-like domain-containing protein n=1 Tax=Pseudorhizobium tarimense TaxID=1079109 RepID=A0ABV2HAB7_9HYPH